MAGPSQNGSSPALGSDWGGLSPHLLAAFFPVVRSVSEDGKSVIWSRDPNGIEVKAPITEANLEIGLNWTSPFENTGPDQKFSSFSALLQGGYFTELLTSLGVRLGSDAVKSLGEKAQGLEGRTNFSRLNSAQSFTGMPPLKLPLTAHFRAMKDARSEVRNPIDQLVRWALPQKLANDGPVGEAAKGNEWFYQSRVPQVIGLKYADILLMPLVIENVTLPVSGQRTSDGTLAYAAVNLQLSSLAAFDANDWKAASSSGVKAL